MEESGVEAIWVEESRVEKSGVENSRVVERRQDGTDGGSQTLLAPR